jgi:hypothetical protein
MFAEAEPRSLTYRQSRGEPEPHNSSADRKKAVRGGNASLIFDQVVSGTVFPAHMLRRAGLLDSMNESLTRIRE